MPEPMRQHPTTPTVRTSSACIPPPAALSEVKRTITQAPEPKATTLARTKDDWNPGLLHRRGRARARTPGHVCVAVSRSRPSWARTLLDGPRLPPGVRALGVRPGRRGSRGRRRPSVGRARAEDGGHVRGSSRGPRAHAGERVRLLGDPRARPQWLVRPPTVLESFAPAGHRRADHARDDRRGDRDLASSDDPAGRRVGHLAHTHADVAPRSARAPGGSRSRSSDPGLRRRPPRTVPSIGLIARSRRSTSKEVLHGGTERGITPRTP